MSSLDTIKAAKDKVLKIVGKDADMPKEKVDLQKLLDDLGKEHEGFDKARETLEGTVLASENALSTFGNGVKQTAALFERSDFGLNSKKPEDAKKIKQAQQIMAAAFASVQKTLATSTKNLDELDKHVIQLGKYKAPT
jgi:hypothetical protein